MDSLRIVSRPGSAPETASLLERASKRLRSLEILGTDDILMRERATEKTTPSHSHTLDINLLHRCADLRRCGLELSFPLLSHLVVHTLALRWTETVISFCRMAPNLTSLDFTTNDRVDHALDLHGDPDYDLPQELDEPTRLRRLVIRYADTLELSDAEEDNRLWDSGDVIAALLRQSPQLAQFSADYGYFTTAHSLIASAASALPSLRDLHSNIPNHGYLESLSDMYIGLTSDFGRKTSTPYHNLRRAILSYLDWELPFLDKDESIVAPSLEILCLDCSQREECDYTPLTFRPPQSAAQALAPGPADLFRCCLRLRHIHYFYPADTLGTPNGFQHLDQLERANEMSGEIRSVVYGDHELIHLRILMQDVVLAASRKIKGEKRRPAGAGRIIHTAGKNAGFDALVIKRSPPVWVDFTDLDGEVVPMEVIERIKAVEGREMNWAARGVKVGAAAWQAVEDWKAERAGA